MTINEFNALPLEEREKLIADPESGVWKKCNCGCGKRFLRLDGASLVGASLDGASLDGASLDGARLYGASLDGASLVRASLYGARLDGASLDGASLVGARLDGARLDGARLVGARLDRASLDGARLVGARYSLLIALQIEWGEISDPLTLELMRWDALACGEDAMTAWAQNGGPCPFSRDVREFHFCEKKSLWSPGAPTMNYRELFLRLCDEKGIKHSREAKK